MSVLLDKIKHQSYQHACRLAKSFRSLQRKQKTSISYST
uniref:Uncharacterized protein n=1 Tax=Arundo donax TaxID=35708 RepID=A0A0A9EMJ6_ARUDO